MVTASWLRFRLTASLLIWLCSTACERVHACAIDPLAPIGWVYSGIKTAVSGAVTVVGTTVDVGVGAYRLANPTVPPWNALISTPSEPPKSGYAPMGCFRDKPSKPDLPFIGGVGRKMNKEKCSKKCQIINSKYFGLQTNPDEKGTLKCWCGNFFGLYGVGTKYDCVNRCPDEEGQKEELCGGEGYNNVYELEKRQS